MTTATANSFWRKERAALGYAGLAPFVGGFLILLTTDNLAHAVVAEDSLRYYAAVIASFLGAVHWGVAASDPKRRHARLRWGVVPALAAWVLLLLPAHSAFYGFAPLFAAILIVDRHFLPLPDTNYQQLRLRLSVIVIVTLVIAALASSQTGA